MIDQNISPQTPSNPYKKRGLIWLIVPITCWVGIMIINYLLVLFAINYGSSKIISAIAFILGIIQIISFLAILAGIPIGIRYLTYKEKAKEVVLAAQSSNFWKKNIYSLLSILITLLFFTFYALVGLVDSPVIFLPLAPAIILTIQANRRGENKKLIFISFALAALPVIFLIAYAIGFGIWFTLETQGHLF